ncbi:hypothetical protein FNV43_RR08064 [Rhamnella rubrinervis]|uniref:Uncharacterized protein n=1 Tax=Rhamnella rubrinervis TaxID=2594499 RepID=A0A8K0HH33_9ROSA|nr:hypothetical protein FNV43_RR08064 [Rhamnella rubrinervis]
MASNDVNLILYGHHAHQQEEEVTPPPPYYGPSPGMELSIMIIAEQLACRMELVQSTRPKAAKRSSGAVNSNFEAFNAVRTPMWQNIPEDKALEFRDLGRGRTGYAEAPKRDVLFAKCGRKSEPIVKFSGTLRSIRDRRQSAGMQRPARWRFKTSEYRRRHEFDGPPRDRLQKFGLTVSPTQLVRHMERIHEVRWPRPMNSDPNTKRQLYGVFHRSATHYECRAKTPNQELLKRVLKQLPGPDKRARTDVRRNSPKRLPLKGQPMRRAKAGGPTPATHITASNPKTKSQLSPPRPLSSLSHNDDVVTPMLGNCTIADIGENAEGYIVFLSTPEKTGINPQSSTNRATLLGNDGMRAWRKERIILPATLKRNRMTR